MKKLREYHEVLIGGSRYIELKGRKISLEELSTYPWISLTSEALTRKFLNNYFADHGLQFLPDMELATTDLILPAVRHNLGIGFVPEEFAEETVRLYQNPESLSELSRKTQDYIREYYSVAAAWSVVEEDFRGMEKI